eukprot:gene4654-5814_t
MGGGKSSKSAPNLSNHNSNNTSNSSLPPPPPPQSSSSTSTLQTSTTTTSTTTTSSPAKTKFKQFLSKINSPTHKSSSSSSQSQRNKAVISQPFGFTHITHVNFDPASQELSGLPKDWTATLKRSANKLVSVRRDSTLLRNINSNSPILSSSAPPTSPLIPSLSMTTTTTTTKTTTMTMITPTSGYQQQPSSSSSSSSAVIPKNKNELGITISPLNVSSPSILLNEDKEKDRHRLPSPDSLQMMSTDSLLRNHQLQQMKSGERPKSVTPTTTTTTTTSSSMTTTTSGSSSTPSSTISIANKLPHQHLHQSHRNSTPLSSSVTRNLSSTNLVHSPSSISLSTQAGSKSMENLVIGNPTYIRREIHITWNHVTGQFEGVPPEWEPLLAQVSTDKQKKKRMELRKRLIREESNKFDKEERNRRLVRDRRVRARLYKEEQRKSIYIPRSKGDPTPIQSSLSNSNNNISNNNNNNNNNNNSPTLFSQQPPPPQHQLSLWQISGSEIFKSKRVQLSVESLCKNDVFVLDGGKKIYVWMGEHSSLQKQVRGCSIANKIKYENQVIIEPISIEFIMENDKSDIVNYEQFLKLLNFNPQQSESTEYNFIVTSMGDCDDSKLTEQESATTWLYRVNDNAKIIAIEEKPIMPTSLNSNTCFILDCETDIFVWHGKHSHPLKQKVAIIFAKEFINIFSDRPPWAQLHVVYQGEEPWFFKERFLYWLEDECIIDNTKRNTTLRGFQRGQLPIPIPIDQNFLVTDLFSIPDLFMRSDQNHLTSGRGQNKEDYQHVSLDIWRSEVDSWKKVSKELHGHFLSTQCYACHHVFKINGKYQSRAYFWQGANAPIKWWVVFQFGLYKELHDHMRLLQSQPPPTECITQNKESLQFLKLFNNIFIHTPVPLVSKNSNNFTSSSSSSSISSLVTSTISPNSSTTTLSPPPNSIVNSSSNSSTNLQNSTSMTNLQQQIPSSQNNNLKTILYQVVSCSTYTKSLQFKEFDISCLNSRDIFIFHSFPTKTMFIWYGKGSSRDFRLSAPKIAETIHKYYQEIGEIPKHEFNLVLDFEEGQEPPIFWKLFSSHMQSNLQSLNSSIMSLSTSLLSVSCQDLALSITNMSKDEKKTLYASNPYFSTSNRVTPKLYHIYYHAKIKSYVITRINPFCQGDLCEDDAFILDCFYKVFVWAGPNCSKKRRECAEELAAQYLKESTIQHPSTAQIEVETSGFESIEFKSYFAGWSNQFTLSTMKNSSQSLIGVGADHRLLNTIVAYGLSQDAALTLSVESAGNHNYDEGTDSPLNATPNSSPPLSNALRDEEKKQMEKWELELESEMEKITRKKSPHSPLIPKLMRAQNHAMIPDVSHSMSGNGSPSPAPRHHASVEKLLEEVLDSPKVKASSPLQNVTTYRDNSSSDTSSYSTSNSSSSTASNQHLVSPEPSPRSDSSSSPVSSPITIPSPKNINNILPSFESDSPNGTDIINNRYLNDTANRQMISSPPPLKIDPEALRKNVSKSPMPPDSPNVSISPVLKNKLLELIHQNNLKSRKRGTSVLNKHPNKQQNIRISRGLKHPHAGSIDAKSLKQLKQLSMEEELEGEMEKIEEELSKIVDDASQERENYSIKEEEEDEETILQRKKPSDIFKLDLEGEEDEAEAEEVKCNKKQPPTQTPQPIQQSTPQIPQTPKTPTINHLHKPPITPRGQHTFNKPPSPKFEASSSQPPQQQFSPKPLSKGPPPTVFKGPPSPQQTQIQPSPPTQTHTNILKLPTAPQPQPIQQQPSSSTIKPITTPLKPIISVGGSSAEKKIVKQNLRVTIMEEQERPPQKVVRIITPPQTTTIPTTTTPTKSFTPQSSNPTTTNQAVVTKPPSPTTLSKPPSPTTLSKPPSPTTFPKPPSPVSNNPTKPTFTTPTTVNTNQPPQEQPKINSLNNSMNGTSHFSKPPLPIRQTYPPTLKPATSQSQQPNHTPILPQTKPQQSSLQPTPTQPPNQASVQSQQPSVQPPTQTQTKAQQSSLQPTPTQPQNQPFKFAVPKDKPINQTINISPEKQSNNYSVNNNNHHQQQQSTGPALNKSSSGIPQPHHYPTTNHFNKTAASQTTPTQTSTINKTVTTTQPTHTPTTINKTLTTPTPTTNTQPTLTSNSVKPPPLQRTLSVKDKINKVEEMVKNISHSSQPPKVTSKPVLTRTPSQTGQSITFKSAINTSSSSIPTVGGNSSSGSNPTNNTTTSNVANLQKSFVR